MMFELGEKMSEKKKREKKWIGVKQTIKK